MAENRNIALIAAETGWGAQIRETMHGPAALKDQHLEDALKAAGLDVQWHSVHPNADLVAQTQVTKPADAAPLVTSFIQNLGTKVADVVKENRFPFVLGGDHAIAAGTWAGLTQALDAKQNFGLIWVDAHMDAHTPETSPSGALHGMPVAALLGHGVDGMVNAAGQGPSLKPEHVVLVGIRSYEEGEAKLLQDLGVKIFFMDDVKERGLSAVMRDALDIVTKNTQGFGISIDLDGFDPQEAPGVGSPAADGIPFAGSLEAFESVATHPLLRGVEIAEYNPERDSEDRKTARLARALLLTLLNLTTHKGDTSDDKQNHSARKPLLCA